MKSSVKIKYLFLATLVVLLLLAMFNVVFGSVSIPFSGVWDVLCGKSGVKPSWSVIVIENRIPQMLTATLCGAALAVSGLMLQTVFSNPLAGPSILGINTGASLGVAIIMLMMGGTLVGGQYSFSGFIAVLMAAFGGSICVMGIIMLFSSVIKSNMMLLIIGIMIGYVASSLISLLNFFATAEGVHSYMIWGMGNFGGVSLDQLPFFSIATIVGLFGATLLIKPLNALLLGDRYAENLGINIKVIRNLLLLVTGILTATTTAYCGPIAFIGLVCPHIARLLLGTQNHNILMPFTMCVGAIVALACNLVATVFTASGSIPINAITPIIGAPIIVYIIVNQKKIHYFN